MKNKTQNHKKVLKTEINKSLTCEMQFEANKNQFVFHKQKSKQRKRDLSPFDFYTCFVWLVLV